VKIDNFIVREDTFFRELEDIVIIRTRKKKKDVEKKIQKKRKLYAG